MVTTFNPNQKLYLQRSFPLLSNINNPQRGGNGPNNLIKIKDIAIFQLLFQFLRKFPAQIKGVNHFITKWLVWSHLP